MELEFSSKFRQSPAWHRFWEACANMQSIRKLGIISTKKVQTSHSNIRSTTDPPSFPTADSPMQAALTVEQHALIVMVVVLLRHLLLSVAESLPQLLIHNFLNLHKGKKYFLIKCTF